MKHAATLVATALAACAHPSNGPATTASATPTDPTAVLQRQTQELLDAVTAGRTDVWDRYTDARLVYAAEDGAVKTKADLLKEISPLPPQISGVLKVTEFTARRHGAATVTSYIVDEQETYFGQAITARYRETDTWIETSSGWRLVGAQVLALRTDPPAIALGDAQLDAYTGTYALTPEVSYTIRRAGKTLVGQRSGRDAETLEVEAPDVLFVRGKPRLRKVFQRSASGAITGFVERRESWDIRWSRR